MTQIVTTGDFDRVSKGVSVVQFCPRSPFAFVAGDNCCFDRYTRSDLFIDGQRVDAFTTEEVVLGDFAESAPVFTGRKR